MFPAPATTAVLYAFQQSDGFGRTIVLLLLLLSIHAWTIMLEKGLAVRRARRGTGRFSEAFRGAASPLALASVSDEHYGPLAQVYESGISELAGILDMDELELAERYSDAGVRIPMSTHAIDKVRSSLERSVDQQVLELESRLGLLGTAVAVSPFLGLLGTVWGVMVAFCGMARHGRPDIGAMAPGVSGALLTTVVGLLVAIPSVVGYNLLTDSVRQATVEMDSFVDDFVARLRLQVGEPGTRS